MAHSVDVPRFRSVEGVAKPYGDGALAGIRGHCQSSVCLHAFADSGSNVGKSFVSLRYRRRSFSDPKAGFCKKTCHSISFPFDSRENNSGLKISKGPRCSSSTIQETDVSRERERLKEELCLTLSKTGGQLNDEGNAIIASLQKLNPYNDITACSKDLYTGFFEGVKAPFRGTGRKGESHVEVEATGTVVTLGRAAFNTFKPQALEIRLNQTYNHVGHGSDDAYSIIIVFAVVDSSVSGSPPLEGLIINRASFSIASAGRMDVMFVSSTLAPRYPETDMERWLKVFKVHNPEMDEKGTFTLALPPIKGWLDLLYLDEDIRITRGNRGSVFVVRRLEKPVVSV